MMDQEREAPEQDPLQRDAIDDGVRVEHVDADKVVVRAILEALPAPIDRQPIVDTILGHVALRLDGDPVPEVTRSIRVRED